jgi:hypothetical protein
MFADEIVEALQLGVRIVFQDQRSALGNADREAVGARFLVRPGEQQQRRPALGLPDRLHGGDLGRLVLQRVEPVQSPTKI